MKKNRLTASVVCAASIGLCCCVNAEVLPQPKTTGGMPLMQAMSLRCSQRDIDPSSTVTKQELSDMLGKRLCSSLTYIKPDLGHPTELNASQTQSLS